ncbi:G-protein coupled receptor Mth2-like [Maniola hyperantus]|uniref:G-protein coupled receptor Mth2-like n=1 Tax=Aphantopus hyperantus TaxID=2795564 RepID=UPI001568B8E1|nr:probable G-protein coupled receptor Mth-like 2 [Maniola hyperantus]
MKVVLIFVAISLISCEPDTSYCCKPDQGVMADVENHCVDIVANMTTPTKLSCEVVYHFNQSDYNFMVTDDGRLILLFGSDPQIEPEQFCITNRTVNTNERSAVVCDEVEEEIIDESVLGYCMIVSIVFLTLTLIVYCALPEMRDLQGKSIINFCASLALGLSILSILKLQFEYSHMGLCAARGFFIYFFLLASFFWTNAISIQILLNLKRPTTSDYGWKAFAWYAAYAWGCPIVLTAAMAIVNFLPGYHRKPGIGLNTCWFYNMRVQWHYMYSVMTILILANICIFVYISVHLWRLSFASTHIRALKYKFVMTVRMIIIMGLPWVFEMISSLSKPHIIWVITDIFNMLQGLLIFLLLVVFRKRVIKAMFKRGWLDCISGYVERYLAVGDDEEDVVNHTTDVGLQETLTK